MKNLLDIVHGEFINEMMDTMSNNALRCENLEMARASVKSILKIDSQALNNLARSFGNTTEIASFDRELSSKYLIPSKLKCYFYHFSLSLNPKRYRIGLLPLHDVYSLILDDLYELIKCSVSTQEWENAMHRLQQMRVKQNTAFSRMTKDNGPFGFLVREFGLEQRDFNEFYLTGSEFIKDVINYTEDIFEINLSKMYEECSRRVIATFWIEFEDINIINRWLSYAIQ